MKQSLRATCCFLLSIVALITLPIWPVFSQTSPVITLPGFSEDYSPNGTGGWTLSKYSTYIYDLQGRLLQRIMTYPPNVVADYRQLFSYNTQGDQTENVTENRNRQTGAWNTSWGNKWLYTYNTLNLKTGAIKQTWQNNSWENATREIIAYDNNNYIISITKAEWVNNTWELKNRELFTHSNGIPTIAVNQIYQNNNWKDQSRMISIVWQKPYYVPEAYELQFNDNGIWANDEKYSTTYGANGSYTWLRKDWHAGTNSWVDYSRQIITKDLVGNQIEQLTEYWDFRISVWNNRSFERQLLTYQNGNVTQRVFQTAGGVGPVTYYDYWKEIYSNFQIINVTGIKNEIPQEIAAKAFPNPVDNLLTIELSEKANSLTAQLSDVTGKVILSQKFQPSEAKKLNLQNLKPGIYLLTLETERGKTVRKIVKN